MMNVRIKFKKGEKIKYISHLDLMRTFQRAIRRAKIPMVYSAGFNPQPEMSFAQALSLGVASQAEYLDLKINDSLSIYEIKERLNQNLPIGLEIIDILEQDIKSKSAMAIVTHSEYKISLLLDTLEALNMDDMILRFMEQEEIIAEKQKSKKDKRIIKFNIKPRIKEISFAGKKDTGEYVLNCILDCGSGSNLKTDTLIKALEDFWGIKVLDREIERIELYKEVRGDLLSLQDLH